MKIFTVPGEISASWINTYKDRLFSHALHISSPLISVVRLTVPHYPSLLFFSCLLVREYCLNQ